MKKLSLIILVLVILMTAVSCKKKEEAASPVDNSGDNGKTFVTINGENITVGEYKSYISYDYAMMDPENKDNKAILSALKSEFIQHRLLLQEAKKEHIKIDEKKFEEMMAAFKKENGEKITNEFEEELDIDFSTVSEQLRQRAIVAELISRKTGNIKVSEKELKDYFNEHKNELKEGNKVHILHIVTGDENKAKEALLMLKKGISFAEVAQKYSIAPEASDGGDLGFVDVSDYPDIFKETLKMKPGQTSNVLKSDYGYHIFRVTGVQKGHPASLDDVSEELTDQIYAMKQEKKLKDYIDGLYKKAKIVYPGASDGGSAPDSSKSGSN